MLDKANVKDLHGKKILALANKYAQRGEVGLNPPVSFNHVTIQNSEETNKTIFSPVFKVMSCNFKSDMC